MRLALGLATVVAVVPGVSPTAAPQTAPTEKSADQVVTVAAGELAPAAARRKAWKLRMVEEFNHFNPRRWSKRHESSNSNEDSYLLASNVRVRGGKLRIQARKQRVGGRHFTSGYVESNGKVELPNYFKVRIRAKVPMEKGLWAAPIWFRPADYSGGEIDLIETYGSESRRPLIHQTIHTDYGPAHKMSPKPTPFSRVGDRTGRKWHVYTVTKVPGRIIMSVDGVRTASWRRGNPGWFDRYYEAGKRWSMRINLQVGGDYGGLPNHTTNWRPDRSAMLVDSIRVWTRR